MKNGASRAAQSACARPWNCVLAGKGLTDKGVEMGHKMGAACSKSKIGKPKNLWITLCCCEGIGASLSEAEAVQAAKNLPCREVEVFSLPLGEWKGKAKRKGDPMFHWALLSHLVGQWSDDGDYSDTWSNLDHDEEVFGVTLMGETVYNRSRPESEGKCVNPDC